MSEKEKKVNEQPQVTLQEKKELLPGITVIPITNFIPLKDLTKDDIRKMDLVRIDINSTVNKKKVGEFNINFKVYPFKNVHISKNLDENVVKFAKYSDLFRLNDEVSNNQLLTRNEYVSIMLNSGISPIISVNSISLLRYARLLTGVSKKTNERYYKLQLFLAENLVKTFWISSYVLDSLSKAIEAKLIRPITFYEATSEELELDKEKEVQEEYI